ncbi:MAG: hypothetical protein GY798_30440 [Hyphomicrobiales bacterium]|nr:hypothetical protein [Hyphomicrobiales bacterium]
MGTVERNSAIPDADDLVSGFNTAGKQEIASATDRSRRLIKALLAPHEPALRDTGLNAAHLADFIQSAMAGPKHSARNRKQLAERLATLKTLVLVLAVVDRT